LYLLDTNILSDMMRNPEGIAAQQFHKVLAVDDGGIVCTSVIVQYELLFGLRRQTHPRWMTHYLRLMDSVIVKPLEPQTARHYADLRTQLEQLGTPIGANDTLIAAHAMSLDATLVTAGAEFTRVPGLQVENWLQPL
jgi:tRNA(fMet)-specific endonuclease VapC